MAPSWQCWPAPSLSVRSMCWCAVRKACLTRSASPDP
jgi:hypothetical protein